MKRHSSNVSKNTFIRKDKQIFKLTKPFKHQPHKIVKYTQTIRRQQPTNCLIACDRFVGLALKGLNFYKNISLTYLTSFLSWSTCAILFFVFSYTSSVAAILIRDSKAPKDDKVLLFRFPCLIHSTTAWFGVEGFVSNVFIEKLNSFPTSWLADPGLLGIVKH